MTTEPAEAVQQKGLEILKLFWAMGWLMVALKEKDQIRTTMRYHFTPKWDGIIQKSYYNKCW